MGDSKRARRYLKEAEVLLNKIDSTYDKACYLEIRARIEHADPVGESNPLRDLHAAETFFKANGLENINTARFVVSVPPGCPPALEIDPTFAGNALLGPARSL